MVKLCSLSTLFVSFPNFEYILTFRNGNGSYQINFDKIYYVTSQARLGLLHCKYCELG